MGMMFSRR
jgi:hypothetical protein